MNATAYVVGTEFARVLGNAVAFLPARSKTKNARLVLSEGRVTVTATDTYTVGRDSCEAEYQGPTFVVEIDREGLQDLEKAARADKKSLGALEIHVGDAVRYVPKDEEEQPAVAKASEPDPAVWEAIDGLLARLEGRDPALPQVIAFDPSLLMRFSKVKADKTERIADFYMTDVWAPVLVKIGPTFTGAIMPIERDIHAERVGPDGLWTTD